MQLQGEILQEEITNISPNRRRRVLMGISFLKFGGCKLCTRGKDAIRNHYQYTALECQILPVALVKIESERTFLVHAGCVLPNHVLSAGR